MLLTAFDPWKSKLCTCPPKLTLNPYTGCSHGCLYCYVSAYVPRFHHARPKPNLLPRLENEARNLGGALVAIANSSDPYPPMERRLELTRKCLRILSKSNCRLQLVTKSNLVTRDIDLLKQLSCAVAMTITTKDDKLSKLLEPQAPLPSKRLSAVRELLAKGVPTAVRIDPIIPLLNDRPEQLIKHLASLGVPHITCSTYKVKTDNWSRLAQTFPHLAKRLGPLYFAKGERRGRSLYLPGELRKEIVEKTKKLVEEEGMRFASCREGFPQFNSATCDGSWLI